VRVHLFQSGITHQKVMMAFWQVRFFERGITAVADVSVSNSGVDTYFVVQARSKCSRDYLVW